MCVQVFLECYLYRLFIFRFCESYLSQVIRERGTRLCVQTFNPLNTKCSDGTRRFVKLGEARDTRQMLPLHYGGGFSNSETISPFEYSYASPYVLSMKQVNALGGKVRKGEKSCPVVFWRVVDSKEDDPDKKGYAMLRY